MNIEYLPGVKPGGKIDLSRFEKSPKAPAPETYLPALKLRLGSLAERLNAEYGDFFELNGQIKMRGAAEESSRSLVAAKERLWAEDSGKTQELMLADRERNPANIAEIAVTLLFDKVLSEDFIIVRASVYDDYENGADQLIIDKKTGAVICGLDDAILGSSSRDDGQKKKTKIDNKMNNGGATIEYGVTMNNGRLERNSLSHIPIFYFNLNKSEMNVILESLAAGRSDLSAAEMDTYAKLVNSLLNQATEYEADTTLNADLKNNLRDFAPSLRKMQVRIPTNPD
jgi:hypothetical protein